MKKMNVNLTEFMAFPILELGNTLINIRQKKRMTQEMDVLEKDKATLNSPLILTHNKGIAEGVTLPPIESNAYMLQEGQSQTTILKPDEGLDNAQKLILPQPAGKLYDRFSHSPGNI
jgi:hypothetical protein